MRPEEGRWKGKHPGGGWGKEIITSQVHPGPGG